MTKRLIFDLRESSEVVDGGLYLPEKLSSIPLATRALSFELEPIDDHQIGRLPALPKLICLDLDGTRITDQSIDKILGFLALRELWLEQTSITDTGFLKLLGIRALEFVSVIDSGVTSDGVRQFERRRPGVCVHA